MERRDGVVERHGGLRGRHLDDTVDDRGLEGPAEGGQLAEGLVGAFGGGRLGDALLEEGVDRAAGRDGRVDRRIGAGLIGADRDQVGLSL